MRNFDTYNNMLYFVMLWVLQVNDNQIKWANIQEFCEITITKFDPEFQVQKIRWGDEVK